MVSVLMITYNQDTYIEEAVLGVLNQKTKHVVELIIADDNSPDNTECIVKDIIKNHQNGHWIEYVKHTQNKGMISNFIWAFNKCQGKYIALCEGDDYWTDPYKLQKQVDFLEANPDYGLVYGKARIYNQKTGKFVGVKGSIEGERFETEIIRYLKNSTPTVLFRKDLFEVMLEDLKSTMVKEGQMSDSVIKYWFLNNSRVKFIDEFFAVYRELEESACHTNDKKEQIQMTIKALDMKLFFLLKYHINDENSQKKVREDYIGHWKEYIDLSYQDGCRDTKKTNEYKVGYYLLNPFLFIKKLYNIVIGKILNLLNL
jgi:glycosyltransferase involved in cell wall biosynthesis